MKSWSIDINCDVGEGVGNEASIFPLISSCNVACGGHAGNLQSMLEVVQLARQHNVKLGAHPAYPDKTNFGREVMTIPEKELKQSILNQLWDFDGILEQEMMPLHHIKAHGALYNESAKNEEVARIFLEAVFAYGKRVPLYVPFGSIVAKMALAHDWPIHYEAFADRNYNPDLSLVSRKLGDALIQDPKKVLNHILPIIKEGVLTVVTGERLKLEAQTICIHGDTPSALQILTYLSKELPKHKVQLQK